MLGNLVNVFRVPELRRKVLFTLGVLTVYRIGAFITVPFVNPEEMDRFWRGLSTGVGGVFDIVNMFSGGAFKQMTIFALGIMPYISASIILQLMMIVVPFLEKIAKEGQAGQKKINQYTRYGTVVLAAFQAFGLGLFMLRSNLVVPSISPFWFMLTTVITMTTGTAFIMWLGEKITEYGIGNGISLIIAFGIMADYVPSTFIGVSYIKNGSMPPIWLPLIFAMMIAVSMLIIYVQQASRKVPVQYARRVVGRKQFQGASTFLPLKINTAGVIPVIFASSILMFPSIIFSFFKQPGGAGGLSTFFDMASPYNLYDLLDMERGGALLLLKVINAHTILYALLTVFFCYFYTAITFNPVDTAENLKKMGGFIPGRRPGKNTSDYIDYVLTRITSVGALFLVVVSMLPQFVSIAFGVPWTLADMAGGTGLIIVIGVFLDTMKQIESQLLMRHYEGFDYRKSRRRWEFRPTTAGN